jgi:hypothetical protein
MSNETETPIIVSDVSAFKKKAHGVPLPLPSGLTCRIRPLGGMEVFMQQGLIPNALMGTIQQALKEGKDGKDFDPSQMTAELLEDPAKLQEMIRMIDDCVVFSVVEPKVHKIPTFLNEDGTMETLEFGDDRRDPNRIYVDEVDINDKMFIFQVMTGGTKNLERFREEQAKAMGALASVEDVARPAE